MVTLLIMMSLQIRSITNLFLQKFCFTANYTFQQKFSTTKICSHTACSYSIGSQSTHVCYKPQCIDRYIGMIDCIMHRPPRTEYNAQIY